MEKINQKTEEIILIVLALIVLFSSMFNPTLSIILAIAVLVIVFIYNYLTKKK